MDGRKTDLSFANPSTVPLYLLADLAVGGPWAGEPSATSLPAELLVDYVRVWQRA